MWGAGELSEEGVVRVRMVMIWEGVEFYDEREWMVRFLEKGSLIAMRQMRSQPPKKKQLIFPSRGYNTLQRRSPPSTSTSHIPD